MSIPRARGYTLIEVMVVLATIMLLAAVTMPVFRAAKESARRSVCISNFRQVALASQLYVSDYEDRQMPVNHRPGFNGPPGIDRTWVQVALPYVRSFGVFRCPSDFGRKRGSEGVFDGDLVVNDTDAKFFEASQRVNLGYNHQYLAPVVKIAGQWTAIPRFWSQVVEPSKTLMFIDSVWATDLKDNPSGGGRWIVAPPCRYEMRNGVKYDSFASEGPAWSPDNGWLLQNGRMKYGGAWPWHSNRVNVVHMDGSAASYPISVLIGGCNAKPFWGGYILSDDYLWDLR